MLYSSFSYFFVSKKWSVFIKVWLLKDLKERNKISVRLSILDNYFYLRFFHIDAFLYKYSCRSRVWCVHCADWRVLTCETERERPR